MENQFSPKLKNIILVLLFVVVFSVGWIVNGVFNSPNKPAPSPTPNVESSEELTGEENEPEGVVAGSNLPESTSGVAMQEASSSSRQKVKVVRVVDGDTIEIEGGQTIRYIGVDTPETVKPNTPVQCFGKEASDRNKALVGGKEVEIEKDVSETDRYGRLLRYVFVDDVFVNQYLVGEGYAYASSYPPDVKYQEIFREAQRKAQEENRGLWGSCPVDSAKKVSNASPSANSAVLAASTIQSTAHPTISAQTATPANSAATQTSAKSDCKIKGNISTSGKIYHLPGCGSYEKTGINESQGEKWFCTEEEAIAAGWRKAKNC